MGRRAHKSCRRPSDLRLTIDFECPAQRRDKSIKHRLVHLGPTVEFKQ